MPHEFFSIIIPCLNEEKNLPHLLADLSVQSYQDFEVFIVDGKSHDQTQSIIREIASKDSRFHLAISKRRNVGHQRNVGASLANGSLLLFFDADSRIGPNFLHTLRDSFEDNPYDGFTCYAVPDTDNTKDKIFLRAINLIFETGALIGMPFTFGACIGCKREVFSSIDGFDAEMTFYEDSELAKRIVAKGFSFGVYKEPTYTYSLRRFRKEGTVRMYRSLAPVLLKQILNKKITEPVPGYPMEGGTYFNESPNQKTAYSRKQLDQLVHAIRSYFE